MGMNKLDDIKAVLFDIDDTLFDRKTAVRKALLRTADNIPDLFSNIPEEKIFLAFQEADEYAQLEFDKGVSGDTVRDVRSRAFLRILNLPEELSRQITEQYIGAYPDVSSPVQGAGKVVEKLSEKFVLGIITNAFPDVQYHKLEGIGVRKFFQIILVSEEIGMRKPDTAIFLRAANLLRKEPFECLFVGDSYNTDIIGAKKSGMKACWFNCDNKQVHDEAVKPDLEITTLSQLLNILRPNLCV